MVEWTTSRQALLGYILLPPSLWESTEAADPAGFHSMPAKVFIHTELAKLGDLYAQFFLLQTVAQQTENSDYATKMMNQLLDSADRPADRVANSIVPSGSSPTSTTIDPVEASSAPDVGVCSASALQRLPHGS